MKIVLRLRSRENTGEKPSVPAGADERPAGLLAPRLRGRERFAAHNCGGIPDVSDKALEAHDWGA